MGGGEGLVSGRISEPRGIYRLLSANTVTLPIGQFLAALPPAFSSLGPEATALEELPHPAPSGALTTHLPHLFSSSPHHTYLDTPYQFTFWPSLIKFDTPQQLGSL